MRYVPVSGATGENVDCAPADNLAAAWYSGPSLLGAIDTFNPVGRPAQKPFRMCVSDVYRSANFGDAVGGKVEAGTIGKGDKIMVAPMGEVCTVRAVMSYGEPAPFARWRKC